MFSSKLNDFVIGKHRRHSGGSRCRRTVRLARRPDAVQGRRRRRRPAKWNWKRFFRRIDRIRLHKKKKTGWYAWNYLENVFSDLRCVSNAVKKIRERSHNFLFVSAGKQQQQQKKGMKSKKSSCGLAWTSEAAEWEKKKNFLNINQTRRRANRAALAEVIGRGKRNGQKKMDWSGWFEVKRWSSGGGLVRVWGAGGAGLPSLCSNFKDVMPTSPKTACRSLNIKASGSNGRWSFSLPKTLLTWRSRRSAAREKPRGNFWEWNKKEKKNHDHFYWDFFFFFFFLNLTFLSVLLELLRL